MSKKNLLDHSEAKVRLLGEYLKRFLGIISNLGYNNKILMYDLFCGEGRYENGGEGSSLVIINKIRELHESGVIKGKIQPIDCQFNDIDKQKAGKLDQIVMGEKLWDPSFGGLTITSNDYKDEVQKLVQHLGKLKNEKAFIFIDPYGYKEIDAADIRDLLKNNKSEVLLFLPTQFMYRFDKKGTPEL